MRIFGAVDQLHAGLDYHLARHNVLSSNLANVDTPGYVPRDIERKDRFDAALSASMKTTNSGHIGAEGRRVEGKMILDHGTAPDADGNEVSLDREVVKISSNQVRYETISTLVSSQLSSLAWAASDGRG